MPKDNKKQNIKHKSVERPNVDNDQIGENASGYDSQNEVYKKDKSK